MPVVVYHHPFSRAANVIWMLEELGIDYELRFVDMPKGGHKAPEIVRLNPMGKLPVVTDGDVVVTESAAIALYLADRYSPGKLAPALDDPARATYLRWSFFAPSVIEPALLAKSSGGEFKASQAGWGKHEDVLAALESAVAGKTFLLGERFSMADVVFGGTVRFMLRFKMLEPTPGLTAYAERLSSRPAAQRADAKNVAIAREHGLG
jgi:glutathione S-transferase